MTRIFPSQVVAFIDSLVDHGDAFRRQTVNVQGGAASRLQAVLDLIQGIPSELMPLDSNDFADFTCSCSAIRTVLSRVQRMSVRDEFTNPISLSSADPGERRNPLTVIRDVLAKCPDEYPAETVVSLKFVEPEYRLTLRLDLAAVERALLNSEWKAATVLAGSIVEALLLWAIKNRIDNLEPAIKSLQTSNSSRKNLKQESLDRWSLGDYIDIAEQMKLIEDTTARQARLTQDFRNLIHPGREIRQKQRCTRGTALSAVAAVEHVVNDLNLKFSPVNDSTVGSTTPNYLSQ